MISKFLVANVGHFFSNIIVLKILVLYIQRNRFLKSIYRFSFLVNKVEGNFEDSDREVIKWVIVSRGKKEVKDGR